MNSLGPQLLRQFPCGAGVDGGVDRDDRARLGVRGEFAHHVAHLRVGEHGDADDVCVCDVGHAVRQRRPELGERGHGIGADIEDDQATGPVREPLGHRRALIAQSDVADLEIVTHERKICPPSTLKICPVIHLA